MKQLHYFNFFGVATLVVLCLFQWHANRRLNLEINRLEKIRLEQESKINDEKTAGRGLQSDLTELKTYFNKSGNEASELRLKLESLAKERQTFILEREHFKASLTNWTDALSSREVQLVEAKSMVNQLAEKLNFSNTRFNELATNHNAVVKELEGMRAKF